MTLAILALNAGSSSIKFSLFTAADAANTANGAAKLCQGEISGIGPNPWRRPFQRHRQLRHGGSTNHTLPGAPSHEDALAFLLTWLPQRYATYELAAVGHRIVHGGPRYLGPVLVDAQVLAELRRLIPLAPLHQPHHIAAIEAMRVLHPTLLRWPALIRRSTRRSNPW